MTATAARWRERFPFYNLFFSSAPKGSLPCTLPSAFNLWCAERTTTFLLPSIPRQSPRAALALLYLWLCPGWRRTRRTCGLHQGQGEKPFCSQPSSSAWPATHEDRRIRGQRAPGISVWAQVLATHGLASSFGGKKPGKEHIGSVPWATLLELSFCPQESLSSCSSSLSWV